MSSETEEAGSTREAADGDLAPEIARRTSIILDDVEREAAELRRISHEEARRYLHASRERADALVAERQQRISEISESLMQKAEAVTARLDDAAPVRGGFDNLVRALGNAADRLSAEAERTHADFEPTPFGADASATPPPAVEPAPSAAAPADAEPPASVAAAAVAAIKPPPVAAPWGAANAGRSNSDARAPEPETVAIQLATQGSTRAQVEAHLNQNLGVTDSQEILDEIFGTDSGAESRVPWSA